jgi:hypothetical protein
VEVVTVMQVEQEGVLISSVCESLNKRKYRARDRHDLQLQLYS